jgi:hypothetical protein
VAAVVTVPVVLFLGREQWFILDDWFFLLPADDLTPSGLLEPYWGHWTTVPRLWQSTLYTIFGVNHVLPYRVGVAVAHVACAALLRSAGLRAGADAWVVTILSVFFLAFGPGAENILWGFQVSMTGSLAFGLAQLLLADHDGHDRRRDVASVAFGLLAVASTNVGVLTTVATGVAVLLRRGWRSAALVVAPIAAAYTVWVVLADHDADVGRSLDASSVGSFLSTLRAMGAQVLRDPGPGPTGIVLSAAALVGVVLVVRGLRGPDRPRLAATAGLLCAAALLVPALAYRRGGRVELADGLGSDPTPSRYLHVLVALVLPAVFLAASELARRRSWGRPVLAVAVVACLPRNLGLLRVESSHQQLVALTSVADLLGSYDVVLDNGQVGGLGSTRWLHEGSRTGRIPPATQLDHDTRDLFFRTLVIPPTADTGVGGCRRAAPDAVEVDAGDRMVLRTDAPAVVVADPRRQVEAAVPVADGRAAVRTVAGPTSLEVRAEAPVTAWVCP